jgi:hypothetical protein
MKMVLDLHLVPNDSMKYSLLYVFSNYCLV